MGITPGLPPPINDPSQGLGLPPSTDGSAPAAPVSGGARSAVVDQVVSSGSAVALSITVDGKTMDFSAPVLLAASAFVIDDIIQEIAANPWLDTAVQTAIITLLQDTAALLAKGALEEALVSKDQGQASFQLALDVADTIMEKAELQKEQLHQEMLMGFATLAFASVGAAMSVAGAVKSFQASKMSSKAKDLQANADKRDPGADTLQAGSTERPGNSKAVADISRAKAKVLEDDAKSTQLQSDTASAMGNLMTNSTQTLNSIMSNAVQAKYVIELADYDRLKTIIEAAEQRATHASTAAGQASSDLRSMVDQLLQLAKQIKDAEQQSFNIGLHGSGA